MKIKNKELLRKYVLYESGVWEKPRNYMAGSKRKQ